MFPEVVNEEVIAFLFLTIFYSWEEAEHFGRRALYNAERGLDSGDLSRLVAKQYLATACFSG